MHPNLHGVLNPQGAVMTDQPRKCPARLPMRSCPCEMHAGFTKLCEMHAGFTKLCEMHAGLTFNC
jgi:hypothetical protein